MQSDRLQIQLDYYDSRSRLTDKRIRDAAEVALRIVDLHSEIRIKSPKYLDIFITNSASVLHDRSTSESLCIWVPNYKCSITVRGQACILKKIEEFISHIRPNKENTSPQHSTTPPHAIENKNGKRGFGIVAKDLFGTGYTPENKIRNTELRRKIPLSNSPKQNEGNVTNMQLDNQGTLKSIQCRDVFMGVYKGDSSNSSNCRLESKPKLSYTLTEIQVGVMDACKRGKNIFYTGGAGTGKSTLLTMLIDALVLQHGVQHVFVAATTGLAACAIGGTTIHQFAGISTIIDESLGTAALKVQHEKVVNMVSC